MIPSFFVRAPLLVAGTLAAIIHWFVPRLTRPDLYFAVTVAPGFRDTAEGRLILRRYRQGLIGVSAPALALLYALGLTSAFPFAPLVLLLQLGAYFGLFYRARRRVRPHTVPPTTVREARFEQADRRIPGGWIAACGPFALLAGCAAYLWTHWQRIPTRLIVHWGAHGHADRWAARSPGTVFLPLLIAASVLLAITLLLYGLAHWLRPIYAGGLQGARESRFRKATSILLLGAQYAISLLFCWVAIRPLLSTAHERPPAAIAFLPALIALALIAIWLRLGQGGSRMPPRQGPAADSASPVGDRTEDRFWKLGIFYFNRDDPSVMVEKRFGIGYTMNFAHPVAWIIVLLLLLTPLGVTASIAVEHWLH